MKKTGTFMMLFVLCFTMFAQVKSPDEQKVMSYLINKDVKWPDHHIPETDGKAFYEMIVSKGYKSAVEIGTSEGYSSIWLALALSKTGGKLITIEINDERYRAALKNFREVGLSDFIDARLANAHDLVYKLEGPFDFVLMDADVSTDYLKALIPKLTKGGVFVTHGIRDDRSEYADYLKSLKDIETNFDTGSGYCVSRKK